jgi:hypothetical protein
LGTIAKLYPAALLGPALAAAPRRSRLLWGTAVTGALATLPLLPVLPGFITSVLGYHLDRGILVESTWGNLLLWARAAGIPVLVEHSFGARHLASGATGALKLLATGLSVAAIVAITWSARRRPGARTFAESGFALLLVLLVVASVRSPQFLLWPLAMGAAALCLPGSRMRVPAVLLVAAGVAGQLVFPFLYTPLLEGGLVPLVVLTVQTLLLVAAAGCSLRVVLPARDAPAPLSEVTGR